ncbi:hypothetical protein H6P81_017886 [Aristolochia fimbriata]|uniref:Uncharacterized protein n=1 Tax=Aristolochia fimbriata TaxID=158543 RepID=A0AAV7E3R0_ARIFI|nr:hypothetical protein H6P81_017886 [Aristolochia fimbriata]
MASIKLLSCKTSQSHIILSRSAQLTGTRQKGRRSPNQQRRVRGARSHVQRNDRDTISLRQKATPMSLLRDVIRSLGHYLHQPHHQGRLTSQPAWAEWPQQEAELVPEEHQRPKQLEQNSAKCAETKRMS